MFLTLIFDPCFDLQYTGIAGGWWWYPGLRAVELTTAVHKANRHHMHDHVACAMAVPAGIRSGLASASSSSSASLLVFLLACLFSWVVIQPRFPH